MEGTGTVALHNPLVEHTFNPAVGRKKEREDEGRGGRLGLVDARLAL